MQAELVLCCSLLLLQVAALDSPPVIHLNDQGSISGHFWRSHFNGRAFSAYLNIPYAAPPLGRLRFAPPQDALPWEGVRVATEENNTVCTQMNFFERLEGSEDCLHLNVYSPNLETTSSANLLPVLFWIHGGGFFAGSGNTEIYGPEYFMDTDVVLVTFNYRLGPLGFLSLESEGEEEDGTSNAGFRDQIKALEWTHKNVHRFGGDPERIVLMGESAGGMSVFYHMISPKSQGLFVGAISLSGPVISSYTTWDKRPSLYARKLAQHLGCDQTSSSILSCLRSLPATDLASETQLFLHLPFTGPNVWMPHPDGHYSEDPVIPEDPEVMISKGNYAKVPLIFGTTRDEGAFNLVAYLDGRLDFDHVDRNWDTLGPLILFYRSLDETTEEDVMLARKVRQFYLGEGGRIAENVHQKLLGDAMFYSGTDKIVRHMLDAPDRKALYHYVYSHRGTFTNVDPYLLPGWQYKSKLGLKYFLGLDVFNSDFGVAHGDEIFTMFRPHLLPMASVDMDEADARVSWRIVNMFAEFARSGRPILGGTDWKPAEDPYWYLNITGVPGDMEMVTDDERTERNIFWEEVLKEKKRIRPRPSEKMPVLIQEWETAGRQEHRTRKEL